MCVCRFVWKPVYSVYESSEVQRVKSSQLPRNRHFARRVRRDAIAAFNPASFRRLSLWWPVCKPEQLCICLNLSCNDPHTHHNSVQHALPHAPCSTLQLVQHAKPNANHHRPTAPTPIKDPAPPTTAPATHPAHPPHPLSVVDLLAPFVDDPPVDDPLVPTAPVGADDPEAVLCPSPAYMAIFLK